MRRRALIGLPLLLFTLPPGLAAQALPGFAPPEAARQQRLERMIDTLVRPAAAREASRQLSATPHVAGTGAQSRTAAYVLQQLARAGLDTVSVSFRVYLPFQDSAVVELLRPERKRFRLEEPALREDPATLGMIWPAMNAYSGVGDVTAEVVYVNYGLPSDFATLDSLGVSVRGRVVMARYGRSYRGVKAREAERYGAAALLLYSDPQDDGYFVGLTYPNGPMRPPEAVQRGSLGGDFRGDLTTPGWPSGPAAERISQDSLQAPRIPVVPLGYRNAELVLKALQGKEVPQGWQGGLPFRYRIGAGEVSVRVAVWAQRGEAAYKTISNTVAILRGAEWPDRWVIAGAHRDAWGPGAADNVSGTVTIIEAGRALGRAAAAGLKPRRTIMLATWDAEEWGLVGSVEQVELQADSLRADAVAYLNLDMPAFGRRFGAGGSTALRPFVAGVAAATRQPGESLSVLQAWRQQARTGDSLPLPWSDLGGGSDFSGFYNVLGIPSFEMGFGGRYGVYHSAYDTFTWMERYGDPGFLSHAAAARMTGVALSRLANASVLPLDYGAFAGTLATMVSTRRLQAERNGLKVDGWRALDSAVARLQAAGQRVDSLVRTGAWMRGGRRAPADLAAVNDSLRVVEQAFVRPEGIPGRPFYRFLLFAPGRDDGYGAVGLPSFAEAIEDGKADLLAREVADLTARTVRAAELVEGAAAILAPTVR